MQGRKSEDREARIRRRAYELWEESGRPEGQEAEHWAQASRDVDAASGPGVAGSAQAARRVAKAVGAKPSSRRRSPQA
jgi:hypothetical protein